MLNSQNTLNEKETKNPSPSSSNKIYESKIKMSEYGLSNYNNKLDIPKHKRTVSVNEQIVFQNNCKNNDFKLSGIEDGKITEEPEAKKICKFFSNQSVKNCSDAAKVIYANTTNIILRESCPMPAISLFENPPIQNNQENNQGKESTLNDSLRVQKFPLSKATIKFGSIGELDNEPPNNISPTGDIKTPLPTSTCSKRFHYAKSSLTFSKSVDECEEFKHKRESSKVDISSRISDKQASNSSERQHSKIRHEKLSNSPPFSIFAERTYQHVRISESPTYSEVEKTKLLDQIKDLKKRLHQKEKINTSLIAEISHLKNENNDLRNFVNYIISSHIQI